MSDKIAELRQLAAGLRPHDEHVQDLLDALPAVFDVVEAAHAMNTACAHVATCWSKQSADHLFVANRDLQTALTALDGVAP